MSDAPPDTEPGQAPVAEASHAAPNDPRLDGRARTLQKMEQAGYRYEFFQAVRLLAAARGGPHTVGGPSPSREAVHVSPDAASVFPAADVRHIVSDGADVPVRMEVGFGGFFGVDAALPTSFHERVSPGDGKAVPLRDFLDLVGHRPYAQLWRAWARYRPEVRRTDGQPDAHGRRAAALTGIGPTDDIGGSLPDLLPLAARLSSHARNAEGLRALLGRALGHAVRIVENVPRRVRLAERPPLGRARLGLDAVVGETVADASGMFRIEVGPMGLDAFRDLLPGNPGATRVASLVQHYTSDALAYEVELLLRADEAPKLRLGDAESARLGRNAHLGAPQTALVRRRVRYA